MSVLPQPHSNTKTFDKSLSPKTNSPDMFDNEQRLTISVTSNLVQTGVTLSKASPCLLPQPHSSDRCDYWQS